MHGQQNIKKKLFLATGPLKVEPVCFPETPVPNTQPTPRNISEERKSQHGRCLRIY